MALYIALDAISFIHPLHGLNITPWNPAPALGLVYLIRRGKSAWLPLMLALLIGEVVIRGIPASPWASLTSLLVLAGGYLLLGELLRVRLPQGTLFDDRASLLSWIFLVALGTLLISLVYIGTLTLVELLPPAGLTTGVLQFWIGDGVGIAVAMPLLWWLSSERGLLLIRTAALKVETLGYTVLGGIAIWAAFVLGDENGFKLFYLLFLPIVWAAARQGMAGAIISASSLQIGVITATQVLEYSAVTIAELQILALALALIGFLVGAIVDEQRRTSEELRQSLRLAAAGEMAGALAHELNQPLTALTAYANACEVLLQKGESGERLQAAIRGMLDESRRTGEIVSRLRDFFRTGATRLRPIALQALIQAGISSFQPRATRAGVQFHAGPMPQVLLLADQLQLEVVLRNLLSNALDAVTAHPAPERWIRLHASLEVGSRVCLAVEDSGPGLSPHNAAHLFEPFHSSKASGLGLGLVISRAIVETHGGHLWGEVADHGIFKLTLPVEDEPAHDP